MVTKEVVSLVDDIDGGDAAHTIDFSVNGDAYRIDLNDKNAAQMLRDLRRYVEHAQSLGKLKGTGLVPVRRPVRPREDLAAVREWFASEGILVSARGRLPKRLMEIYDRRGRLSDRDKTYLDRTRVVRPLSSPVMSVPEPEPARPVKKTAAKKTRSRVTAAAK